MQRNNPGSGSATEQERRRRKAERRDRRKAKREQMVMNKVQVFIDRINQLKQENAVLKAKLEDKNDSSGSV